MDPLLIGVIATYYWPFVIAGLLFIVVCVHQYILDGLPPSAKKSKKRREKLLRQQKILLIMMGCFCALGVVVVGWAEHQQARQDQNTWKAELTGVSYPLYELKGSFSSQYTVTQRTVSGVSSYSEAPAKYRIVYQSKVQTVPAGQQFPSLMTLDVNEYDARLATYGTNDCISGGPKLQTLAYNFAHYTCRSIGEWQGNKIYGAYAEVTDETGVKKMELMNIFAAKGSTLINMHGDSTHEEDYMKAFQALQPVDPYKLRYFVGG